LRNIFEMSNKFNKIRLKGLNPHISKVRKLNWIKVSKNNQFQFSLKLKRLKTYLIYIYIYI